MPNATFSRRFAAVVLPLMLAAAGCAHNPPARKINVAGQTLTSSISPWVRWRLGQRSNMLAARNSCSMALPIARFTFSRR